MLNVFFVLTLKKYGKLFFMLNVLSDKTQQGSYVQLRRGARSAAASRCIASAAIAESHGHIVAIRDASARTIAPAKEEYREECDALCSGYHTVES